MILFERERLGISQEQQEEEENQEEENINNSDGMNLEEKYEPLMCEDIYSTDENILDNDWLMS